jgi:ketosteroid isomerase-like protein
MTCEQNRQLVRAFFDQVMNGHDVKAAEAFLSPDFVHHTPLPGTKDNLPGFQQGLTVLFIAYYDVFYQWDECFTSDETVIVRWTAEASHPGSLFGRGGVPMATGRKLRWSGMTMVRVRAGRIDEMWVYQDEAAVAGQMRALPYIMSEN